MMCASGGPPASILASTLCMTMKRMTVLRGIGVSLLALAGADVEPQPPLDEEVCEAPFFSACRDSLSYGARTYVGNLAQNPATIEHRVAELDFVARCACRAPVSHPLRGQSPRRSLL